MEHPRAGPLLISTPNSHVPNKPVGPKYLFLMANHVNIISDGGKVNSQTLLEHCRIQKSP